MPLSPGRAIVLATALAVAAVPAPSPPRTWVEPVTGMPFVSIPAGTFEMGSPEREAGREPQERAHAVTLTRPFWIGAHEVTQAQWRTVMGTAPSHFRGDDLPVERVSWHDVQAFVARLSALSPGPRFRLPTEAEWEYACRAGSRTAYAWGDTLSLEEANVAVLERGALGGRRRTTPVATFRPNAWGLYDMHGNVWEWTEDAHCAYGTAPARDPVGRCNAATKVIRGGSWYFAADSARCGLRYTHRPKDVGFSLGVRVVRDVG
ncbi:hypothetical protein TBR22_A33380 [Luteitalea sp. TBR-22]|uniref:formylglycine-generating enzyme family protein n=1 Tax=Luteitalea sp. TBR-22 TaxID=2802971 RepID=UPI001AF5B769|nr:formylglycine-generating enzyme family protein [Luteitalea sp. TBR-22]BCS34109.1 hypothetical protein TBR22_A33380 [Luteitalea sp. TBR-22]